MQKRGQIRTQEYVVEGSVLLCNKSYKNLYKQGYIYMVHKVLKNGDVKLSKTFYPYLKESGHVLRTDVRLSNFILIPESKIKEKLKNLCADKGYKQGVTLQIPTGDDLVIGDKPRYFFSVNVRGVLSRIKLGGHLIYNNITGWTSIKKIDEKMSLEKQILDVVKEHLKSSDSNKIVEGKVEILLDKWGISKNVKEIVVNDVKKGKKVQRGKEHFKFPLVLAAIAARTNIALVGAAGSGKTTTVKNVAESLSLKFYSKSVSQQTGIHEFFGYQNAQGDYVTTLFREAYEKGGVFLLDEFDAGNPNVLAALNQATANDSCAFADGMIPKHEDFICVMAGNTFGHGATMEYVGRNKIDAATLDRFVFIEFPYDEALEKLLSTNKRWCERVQKIRKRVADKKVRTIISPRATFNGQALLEQGISEEDVMELTIYKGLSEEERELIKI